MILIGLIPKDIKDFWLLMKHCLKETKIRIDEARFCFTLCGTASKMERTKHSLRYFSRAQLSLPRGEAISVQSKVV